MEYDDRKRKRFVNTLTNENGKFQYDIHLWVFFVSTFIIVVGVAVAILTGRVARDVFLYIQNDISKYLGWFYVLVVNIILIYCISLMFSKYGNLKIGGSKAEPEFSLFSWFAMLFSAGMGIGLVFYGVAEPIYHYSGNYFNEATDISKAKIAMSLTFLHWGFHPWAIYSLVGLGLAFFGFSEKLPFSIRNIFYPLLGKRIYGFFGNVIDITAVVTCLYGLATSLGLGVKQLNAGLNTLFGIGESTNVQIILVAIITSIALWSVMRGLSRGIKLLSNINMVVAILLMILIICSGPTLFILNTFVENIGTFMQQFPKLALWKEGYTMKEWQNNWTIFYWGWWISWSPFVGMFIARVSYGRTIREFLGGVLFVPTILTFLWMTTFGGSALYFEVFKNINLITPVKENIAVALFEFFKYFPIADLISIIALFVIISFFVTSSDSGSMIIDIITSGGNPNPPKMQRLFWATMEGVVAATLVVSGGLIALQTASIIAGLPFAIVLLFMCWSISKGLKRAYKKYDWS